MEEGGQVNGRDRVGVDQWANGREGEGVGINRQKKTLVGKWLRADEKELRSTGEGGYGEVDVGICYNVTCYLYFRFILPVF